MAELHSKEPLEITFAHSEGIQGDAKQVPRTEVPSMHDDQEEIQEGRLNVPTYLALLALAITYETLLFSFILPAAILLNINKSIGPSTQYTWIATSWTLATAVTQTIAGRCSDIFGRRNFFITGNLAGLVGCTIGGRASSIDMVIAGTAIMGFGAGLQYLACAAACEIVPKKHRGTVMGCLSLVGIPGSGFGSVIAFAIVRSYTWRWTFYLGMVLNGLALVLVILFYWPPDFLNLHPEGKTRFQQFKELDFVGLLLFGGGLTIFLVGISFGGNPYPWSSSIVVAPTVCGGVALLVAFPLWETYGPVAGAKLCPPEVVKNIRGVSVPLVVSLVAGMALISLQVFWPQQVQILYEQDLTQAGWYILSYNASATAGCIISGALLAIIRRTKYQFIGYVWWSTLFISLMSTVNQNTPARAIAFVALASFALGAIQILAVVFVGFGTEDRHIGVAVGLVNTLRSTGGAIALAVYSAVFFNKVSKVLAPRVAAAAVQAGLPAISVENFIVYLTSGVPPTSVPGITPQIIAAGVNAMKSAYSSGFRLIYLTAISFGLLSCIVVSFVNSVDSKLTKEAAVKVGKLAGSRRAEAKVLRGPTTEINP